MSSKAALRQGAISSRAQQKFAKKARGRAEPPKKKLKSTPVKKFNTEADPRVIQVTAKEKGKERAGTPLPSTKKSKPKRSAEDEVASLPSTFKIIAGTYEKLLYGLEGHISADDSGLQYELKPLFIFPAHVSCIKAVAASPNGGKWLATGSADEIIKVWDLRRRKEIGGLMHHEGSITHLEFPSRSHLLSASEDGTLCLFRARDWSVLRALKGHKGRVNSVAVHPSGKVALSAGKDRTLRMWDLMRGKGSASTKIGKEGEIVRWSTDGSLFVVQTGSTIDLYNTNMVLLHTINHPSRLHDAKFCKRVEGEGEVLLVAAEDKKVSVYNVSTNPEQVPQIIAEMVGHTNRVKALDTLAVALPPSPTITRTSTTLVSTVSSDGTICLFDMAALPVSSKEVTQITALAEYDTKGCRLTCVTLADGEADKNAPANGKRKRTVAEDDGGASEDEEDEDEEDSHEEGWSLQKDGQEEEEDESEDEDEDEDEQEDEIEE